MNYLALLLDLFGNSEETNLLICTAIFVWCLQRRRNGGLNSGQKSAIIVTDAFIAQMEIQSPGKAGSVQYQKDILKLHSLLEYFTLFHTCTWRLVYAITW